MKRVFQRLLGLLFLTILLASCGYRTGERGALTHYSSMSVPYVKGESDGRLTAAIIHEICSSSPFKYRRYNGDLTLNVEILELKHDNIGYEYDTNNDGTLTKRIVPDEGRLNYLVEISVVDARSGKVLLGPTHLTANVDYDFNPYSVQNQISVFSLGQFTAIDAAEDAAHRPLDNVLAIKIISYISSSW
jgi:hypothetical protein